MTSTTHPFERPLFSVQSREDSPCHDLDSCRTTWGILLSCIITVLACAWVSIHPNSIHPVNPTETSILKRSNYTIRIFLSHILPIFALVFAFPEFVLAMAIKQRLAADKVAGRLRKFSIIKILHLTIVFYCRYDQDTWFLHSYRRVPLLRPNLDGTAMPSP